MPIPSVDGAVEGVMHLSKKGEVYVVSARKVDQTENTAKWCLKNGIVGYLQDVASTNDQKYAGVEKIAGSKKVRIAMHLGAKLFVDDDPRHMPNEAVDGLHVLLFGEAERRDVPGHITIARTWDDVKAYADRHL